MLKLCTCSISFDMRRGVPKVYLSLKQMPLHRKSVWHECNFNPNEDKCLKILSCDLRAMYDTSAH